MKKSIIALGALAVLTASSCGRSDVNETAGPVVLEMSQNTGVESSEPMSVKDAVCTRLSGDSSEAFFKNASILDVAGDTVILLENNPAASRLIMFSAADGRYLGQINHQGQGPGEYSRIIGAFVDAENQTVMLPDFHTPAVNVYSLAADTLAEVIEREFVPSVVDPIGSVATCINVACPTPEGLDIVQYGRQYALIDSVSVPGFKGGNFSTVWVNAGKEGVMMTGDTIYALLPGELKPLAIADRGSMTITPKTDEELMMKIMGSGESETEVLKPYILIRNIAIDGDRMLLTSMHNGQKTSDLYDMTTGRLIYRNSYDTLPIPSCIVIETGGRTISVERLFAKDGVWYGLLSDDASEEEANSTLVSFRL